MYIIIIYILIMEEIYKRFNRPGAQKLYQLAKNERLNRTLKQAQEFLGGRVEEQHLKKPRAGKKNTVIQ